ncbi:hypothetical protein HW555_006988 [Spodoptera exigua]|uniref:Uncharacterized protein n=1 Tax=Spodoptera exigua TaxID=7107 RepID=A0A835L322_SPOEX|nr:hypothetical protein HW555_006988 [Spodoptera exigua]
MQTTLVMAKFASVHNAYAYGVSYDYTTFSEPASHGRAQPPSSCDYYRPSSPRSPSPGTRYHASPRSS